MLEGSRLSGDVRVSLHNRRFDRRIGQPPVENIFAWILDSKQNFNGFPDPYEPSIILREARNECEARDEGRRKIKLYFSSPSSRASHLFRASCKMPRSPRLTHKAPVMQAIDIRVECVTNQK